VKQYVKLLKGKRLVSAHGVGPSTWLLSGALVWRRASVDFARWRKARGMWLLWSVIPLGVMRWVRSRSAVYP